MKNGSVLYIVGIPIGNADDISLRALEKLKSCDLLLCESRKEASRLFHKLNISFPRENWMEINEHTQPEEIHEALAKIQAVKQAVLISDSGMPVICDPGADLIAHAEKKGILIQVVPGPTALTAALALSAVSLNQGFHFLGFPPQKTEKRTSFFKEANQYSKPVVFYETPYRLKKLLQEIHLHISHKKNLFVAVDATAPTEYCFRCRIGEIPKWMEKVPKGAPVVVVH